MGEPRPLTRKITASEAILKTAAVEVKTLTLNGKQMTMAVFRQLQKETLIAPDTLTFNGVPWGNVNYFWGDCTPNHLHVVWQNGNELRRDCVYPTWPELERTKSDLSWKTSKVSQAADAVILLHAYRTNEMPSPGVTNLIVRFGELTISRPLKAEPLARARDKWAALTRTEYPENIRMKYVYNRPSIKTAATPYTPSHSREPRTETEIAEALAEEQKHLNNSILSALMNPLNELSVPDRPRHENNWRLQDTVTADTIKACVAEDALRILTLREWLSWKPTKWAEQYAALCGLDQLFIAA